MQSDHDLSPSFIPETLFQPLSSVVIGKVLNFLEI